ncbi:FAD-dependent oxidoreductase [Glaciihabitans sp. dw_435]|uniref:FAD-dependent oxidoreductase n=1 Tax=Glaciihabitans sp. dw_435 TaxID=2720081 RepID=UPI001BD20645|nr:FAD-dependent oxidoreductase [Glaciihabitans sp. dw_435]
MTSLWLSQARDILTDEFVAGAHFDEVIVGAGITGLVSAVLFARAGRRVAVLESRTVGAGTTGNTTAKISQLQGTQFSKVHSHGYQAMLQAYADGNRDAFDWLMDYTSTHGIEVERRDAVTYAGTADGAARVDREFELARSVGLDVARVAYAGLPFTTFGAVVLPNQAQFDPLDLLAALAAELRSLGGVIFEGTRVTGVRASQPARVQTYSGELTADHVILATGTPILDRGLYFAKVSAERSYAQSFELPGDALPDGMYLGVETPTRSIRTSKGLLLTGGNGHPVGREASPQARADDLTAWTKRFWPGAELTHAWSAQDYSTAHRVPFVGWLPRGRQRIFLATGYDKWGMTGGVAAALTLVADILGSGSTQWQTVLHHRVTMPRAIGRGIGENAAVAWWYAKGYTKALSRPLPAEAPAEGVGVVGRQGLKPTVESTVNGTTCALSAVCSHLGAVVTWNDAEKSWDCPAHGSRFAADGTRLEGPATRDLRPR